MPAKSTIDLLDDPFREGVLADLRDGRKTIGEMVDSVNRALESAGRDERISWSAMQRYGERYAGLTKEIRRDREFATVLVKELGVDEGAAGRVATEGAQGLALRLVTMMTADQDPDPDTLRKLCAAIKDLSLAQKTSTEMREKIRSDERRQAAEVAGKALKEQAGLSDETVAAIKQRILGVA